MKPTVLLLDTLQATVLRPDGSVTTVPLAPTGRGPDVDWASLAETVAAGSAASREVVVIVGGGWLESAEIALPAIADRDRRRALHYAAERSFPLGTDIATTIDGTTAMACDAAWLRRLITALDGTRVRSVLALPVAAALTPIDGTWSAPAADAAGAVQHLLGTSANGRVQSVRRVRGAPPATVRALDIPAVLRAMQQRAAESWTAAQQLLDLDSEAALARAAQRAWWRAGVLATAALLFATWALGQREERRLAATRAAITEAARAAAPALAAAERVARAHREQQALATAATRRPDEPAAVLARLGSLLPAGAFVQHLEWDGTQWRIDGSATDAAVLVPRLDADPLIEAVRVLAPSTRFLDGTTPRSSFSIGFTVRGAAADTGASHGTP